MSVTDNEPATPDPDNEEMAQAIFDHAKEQQEQEKEAQTQAERNKQQILSAVQSDTVDVPLYGTQIEFRIMSGEEEDWLDDASAQFMDADEEDELNQEEFQQYQAVRDRMIDILAEHSVEEEYDRAFWKQLPSTVRQQVLGDLRQGGINADRAGNSR